ncbi:MAG: hypothetical protein ABI904_21625 [Chloroflexota bacterium]
METLKEKSWKTKLVELPLLLRFVVLWIYIVSISYLLKSLLVFLFQLSLDVFSLIFGFLVWVLASGLIDKSNLARIIALIYFGFVAASTAYLLLSGGTVSFGDWSLTFLYPSSAIWLLVSSSSFPILLLPQVRRLFLNSTKEGEQ